MPPRFPSLPNATLGSENRNFQLGKLNLFTKGNAPSLLYECGFVDAAPEFHNYRRGRSCQGTLPFSVRNLPGKSIQGYSAKYPRILRNLSKDMSFPDFTRHFSYSQTESVDSVVGVILNQLADWSPGYIG